MRFEDYKAKVIYLLQRNGMDTTGVTDQQLQLMFASAVVLAEYEKEMTDKLLRKSKKPSRMSDYKVKPGDPPEMPVGRSATGPLVPSKEKIKEIMKTTFQELEKARGDNPPGHVKQRETGEATDELRKASSSEDKDHI